MCIYLELSYPRLGGGWLECSTSLHLGVVEAAFSVAFSGAGLPLSLNHKQGTLKRTQLLPLNNEHPTQEIRRILMGIGDRK